MLHRSRLSFQCPYSLFISLSGAYCLRLALPSTFQEHILFGWRFFFQPFRSRLPAVGASSLSLSGADCLRLAFLLSASQQQTSFDWRFFFQPFRSIFSSADASSFNLSGADCLRLAFLSASQQQTACGWRFFSQPFSSRLPSAGASSFSLSAADFFRLTLLLVGTRFFAALPLPNDRVQARGGCGVSPSRADPFGRVSPPPAGGEAASPATDVGRRALYTTNNFPKTTYN
jgi:hypothetical protein